MSTRAHVMRPQTFRTFPLPRAIDLAPEVFVQRHEMAKEVLAAEADTQGWDAASAVRLSQVNAALAKSGVYPPTFQQEVSVGWTIEGTFGPWQMTRGGSGSIVFLRTPIVKATMNSPMGTMEFENGWATIQVKLNYLPHSEDKPDPARGNKLDLLTDTENRSDDDPAVVVQKVSYGDQPVPDLMKALFENAFAKWGNANLALFNYVFAVVSLNQVAQAPQFQWLKPTYTGYAYYDGPKEDPSEDVAYFGVLNMTSGQQPEGLANQLPASAIPPDQGAALLIGMRLFLENMVLPGVQAAFPTAGPGDFKPSNGNTSIELTRELPMEKVRVGAVWYEPVAQEFILQIIGDEIQTRSKIHVPISPGLDAYVTTESWYRVELVTKDDGTQTIGWVESRPAKKDHWYTKETWVTIVEAVVAVIGAVAAIVAGMVLQGVLRIVVVIIIGILAGVAAAIPELVAKAISEGAAKALPPIEMMLVEFVKPVEWPDTAGFTLKRVELNGSLQLSGSFDAGS